jgi:hypothetical protein
MKWSDIQKVRLGAERTLARGLRRHVRCRLGESSPEERAKRRRQWVSGAVLLSRGAAPYAYGLFEEAARALDLDTPFELYQRSGEFNACVDPWLEGHILISLRGPALTSLDAPGLRHLAGHEFGHHLAHGAGAWTGIDPGAAYHETRGEPGPLARLGAALSQAGELTCDRFGLLACRDLDAALRANVLTATSLPTESLGLDPRAYLDDCRAVIEKTLERGEVAHGDSHPEHSLRAFALWLFSESDLYAALTGDGPATRAIADVDATLAKLLGVPDAPPQPRKEKPATRHRKETAAAPAPSTPAAEPLPAVSVADSLRELTDPISLAVTPTLSRGIDWIRDQIGPRPAVHQEDHDPGDLMDDDLERRFEALERQMGSEP